MKPSKRHRTIMEQELNKIEEDKHDKNTKRSTTWAVNAIQGFLLSKGMIIDISSYNAVALNNMLREFYASVQPSKGGEYSIASLLALRAGLNRHIPAHNIISDPALVSGNNVFKSIMKRYRKQGNDRSAHPSPALTSDFRRIRGSEALSLNILPAAL